ncbi:hypothetical protein [Streptomyces sioyaensis]|uniref:hypothetical protein n=1 Tax=Streptomyces sioyaensis TaxID=67364 RepID=UPI003D74EE74
MVQFLTAAYVEAIENTKHGVLVVLVLVLTPAVAAAMLLTPPDPAQSGRLTSIGQR